MARRRSSLIRRRPVRSHARSTTRRSGHGSRPAARPGWVRHDADPGDETRATAGDPGADRAAPRREPDRAGAAARRRQHAARPLRRHSAPYSLARPLPRHSGAVGVVASLVTHLVSQPLNRRVGLMRKVVLAYSGGLDTSVAVAWLKEQFGVEVV